MSASTGNRASTCPNCGAPLPSDAPRGLCPECLLLGALQDKDAAATGSSPGLARPGTIHIIAPLDEAPGAMPEGLRAFGDYELLEQIAAGGMGVVFKARQLSLNRFVAVKMIRAGQLAREADIRRFRTEAEAAANLKHPHIVAIHEVGEHEGRHFFSMDYIEGRTLAELARTHPMEPAQAARLLQTIAGAIAYAHRRGILHRDLKPGNVLLDAEGRPHVTDFGLAKMLQGDSELTQTGAILGSPSYMSPEQARGHGEQVSVRSDVYSLGAMLYELLTTRPPFLAATPLETMKLVAESEPVSPRVLNPSVPRDLETICLKCLQKEPKHRYASAEALADELGRFLAGEPIHARPGTAWEKGVKWTRRHPARAALFAVCLLVPAVIIALLLFNERRVTSQRNRAMTNEVMALNESRRATLEAQRAEAARAESRLSLYAADMLLAQHALDEGNLSSARRHVLAWKPARAGTATNASGTSAVEEETWLTEADGLRTDIEIILRRDSWSPLLERMAAWSSASALAGQTNQAADDPRGFEWRYLWQRCQGDEECTLRGHSNAVGCVTFSHDGKMLASGDAGGLVHFWSTRYRRANGQPLRTGGTPLVRLSYSPDDKMLCTTDDKGVTKVWDLFTRKVRWSDPGRNQASAQLAPAGNLVGVSYDRDKRHTGTAAEVIDWKTGKQVLSVDDAGFVGFTPDARQAIVGTGRPLRVDFWDLATGRMTRRVPNFGGAVFPSPDGRYLAAYGVWDTNGFSNISMIDLLEDKPATWVQLRGGLARRLAFAPDNSLLAIAGADQCVRLWDVITHQERPPLLGHAATVEDLAFSPDGLWLATASADKTVKIWSAKRRRQQGEVFRSEGRVAARFLLSPNGRLFAAHKGHHLGLWLFDLETREITDLSRDLSLRAEFFSADSRTLFARTAVTSNGVLPLLRWDVSATARPIEPVLLHLGRTNEIGSATVSPNRNLYAVHQYGSNAVSLWNPMTGAALGQLHAPPKEWIGGPGRFSPDGRKLVALGWPSTVQLIEMAAPERQWSARLPSRIFETAFSPDGKTVSVACEDHTVRLFDSDTLKELAVLPGHQFAVTALAWSPDGRTLASVGGGVVKLWSMAARREVATVVRGGIRDINSIGFTPDGNALWVGTWQGEIHLWRVPTLSELDRPRQ